MSEPREYGLLQDILEAGKRMLSYTEQVEYDAFLQDTKTQDAVIRNIEIIGEATKQLSETLKTTYPNVPWNSIAKMRDKLIHHYFGVNLDIVWHVAKTDLPALLTYVDDILEREYQKDLLKNEEDQVIEQETLRVNTL